MARRPRQDGSGRAAARCPLRTLALALALVLLAPAAATAQTVVPGPVGTPEGLDLLEATFAPAWGFLAYANDQFALSPSDHGQCLAMADLGLVACGVKGGQVLAFDAQGGRLAWQFDTRGPVRGKPARTADGLFVASSDGCLYRLDPATGKATWEKPFCADAAFYGDVAAWKGLVFAASTIDKIYAVDARTGAFRWESHRERPRMMSAEGVASPVVAGDRVLAGFSDGTLAALDAATGAVAWEADLARDVRGSTDVDATPVVAGGTVYASAFGEGPVAVNLADGEILWRARLFGPARPLVAGGLLIVGTADGAVVGISRQDGQARWRTKLATVAAGAPVAVGNWMVVGGDRGLWLMRPRDGRAMVRLSVVHGVRGAPEVQGSRLFFVGGGGTVNAVDVLPP